jgi:uncharacterized protein
LICRLDEKPRCDWRATFAHEACGPGDVRAVSLVGGAVGLVGGDFDVAEVVGCRENTASHHEAVARRWRCVTAGPIGNRKQPMETPPPRAPDRTWDVLCHVSALAGFILPLGNIIGPLIVWLIKKQEMPSVDAHGKESLNFQISVTIYMLVSAILVLVLIGLLLMVVVAIGALVLIIVAAVKAGNGEFFRYPLTIRFIK